MKKLFLNLFLPGLLSFYGILTTAEEEEVVVTIEVLRNYTQGYNYGLNHIMPPATGIIDYEPHGINPDDRVYVQPGPYDRWLIRNIFLDVGGVMNYSPDQECVVLDGDMKGIIQHHVQAGYYGLTHDRAMARSSAGGVMNYSPDQECVVLGGDMKEIIQHHVQAGYYGLTHDRAMARSSAGGVMNYVIDFNDRNPTLQKFPNSQWYYDAMHDIFLDVEPNLYESIKKTKMENCEYLSQVKRFLSCEQARGKYCSMPNATKETPHYPVPSVPLSSIIFKNVTSALCSFECVPGQELCNETLNPHRKENNFFHFKKSVTHHDYKEQVSCKDRLNDSNILEHEFYVEENEYFDEEGNKYIDKTITYEYFEGEVAETVRIFGGVSDLPFDINEHIKVCRDFTTYLVVCEDEQNEETCIAIKEYTEEWFVYHDQQKEEKYKNSCIVPTTEDCKNINEEQTQCMLDVTDKLKKFFCPDINPLWRYRERREYFSTDKEEKN